MKTEDEFWEKLKAQPLTEWTKEDAKALKSLLTTGSVVLKLLARIASESEANFVRVFETIDVTASEGIAKFAQAQAARRGTISVVGTFFDMAQAQEDDNAAQTQPNP